MKNSKIGLSIILIILAIFYYESKRKIPEIEKNIIIDFGTSKKFHPNKKLKYGYDYYKQSGIKKVIVKAYRGRVSIKANNEINEVRIKVIKGYTDKLFKMEKNIKNGSFYIGRENTSNFTGEISYEIEAPEDTDYGIENRYGTIDIAGAGKVEIDDKYSDIRVENVKSTAIQSGYGNIFIKRVKGNATVDTKYGKIDISDIEGNLTVNTKYGRYIKVKKIGRNFMVNTKFTPIIVDRIRGKIKIIDKYCEKIDINNSEDIEIAASYSNIFVDNSKSLLIKGKENRINGNVKSLRIKGKNNKIEGESESLFLEGKYDKLNFTVKSNGNIIEEQGHIRLKIDKITSKFLFDLLSTSSYITINNTKNTYFNVNLNWGRLNSDFLKITTNKNIIAGVFGDKKAENIFDLHSKYSDITVVK